MAAGKHDLYIEKGATFRLRFTLKAGGLPMDLTGYSARMKVKADYSQVEALAGFDLSDVAGITLGGASGTFVAQVAAVDTALLAVEEAVYDIEIEDSTGFVIRIMEGSVGISDEVTR